jgi:hypothetical protein
MRKLHYVPFPFDQIAKRPRRISIDCAEFTPLREVMRFRSEVVIGLLYSFYDGKAEMLINRIAGPPKIPPKGKHIGRVRITEARRRALEDVTSQRPSPRLRGDEWLSSLRGVNSILRRPGTPMRFNRLWSRATWPGPSAQNPGPIRRRTTWDWGFYFRGRPPRGGYRTWTAETVGRCRAQR